MAWTQSDLDALDTAIKSGSRVVQFGDRRIERYSIEEMLKLRSEIAKEVSSGAGTPIVRHVRVYTGSGE